MTNQERLAERSLGKVIRETRIKRDLSLRGLARNINKSPAFISDIELGQRYPSDKTLIAIAQGLILPIARLRILNIRTEGAAHRALERWKDKETEEHPRGFAMGVYDEVTVTLKEYNHTPSKWWPATAPTFVEAATEALIKAHE